MAGNRASRGLLVSALGAAVLAVSVFSPWYSVSITPEGAAQAQQQLATVAQQYGNTSLQDMASQVGGQFSAIAGRPLTTLSAHQALKNTSKILLLLAGVALLASLLTLADVLEIGGGQIALVGFAAVLCVLFRMLSPPGTDAAGLLSLSLGWGSWLALLAAGAIAGGGLWGSVAGESARPQHDPLAELRL
ncbi:MAG TPA: hypothetical protein VGI69_06685 [Gaiellaceae bacterium]|jgi:hypothetical protein